VTVDVLIEVTIERPVAVVSEFAADQTHAPQWYANIRTVEWDGRQRATTQR
jgi:hypothetical protein